MTDTRVGSATVQVAMQVDGPTGVATRVASDTLQVPMLVDPGTIETRVATLTVQVAMQVNRGYVMTFNGDPYFVFADGAWRHLRVL